MVREILSLNVGGCGVRLGEAIWQQYCLEHGIGTDGKRENESKDDNDDDSFLTMFEAIGNKQYLPRNLMIDTERSVINEVMNRKYSKLFDKDSFIYGIENCADNFAAGHYTIGKEMIEKIETKIQKMVEKCDNLQGFIFNHSVSGGTGSGLGTLIMQKIKNEYKKKIRLGFSVYSGAYNSQCVYEAYNALLTTHRLINDMDVSTVLDTDKVMEFHYRFFGRHGSPRYKNLNGVMKKAISSTTVSLRFKSEINVNLDEIQSNFVLFPRLHFLTTAMAPMITSHKLEYKLKNNESAFDVQSITESCLQQTHGLTKFPDFDCAEDPYLTLTLNYRGDVKAKEANESMQSAVKNKKVLFTNDDGDTAFKIGLYKDPIPSTSEDDMASTKMSATMIGNNAAITRFFQQRICKKYDLMYSQRAFVHHYIGEGMEEGEFAEARGNLRQLDKEYLDVLSEQATDDADDDDDEKDNK